MLHKSLALLTPLVYWALCAGLSALPADAQQTYGPQPAPLNNVYGPEPVAQPPYQLQYGQRPAYGQAPPAPYPLPPPSTPLAGTPDSLSRGSVRAGASPWTTLAQARHLIRSRKPEQALPLVDWFIGQRPLEPEGYFWKGIALDNLNHAAEALAAFQTGIANAGRAGMDSAELRLNAGNCLLKLGRVGEAAEQYRRAVEVDPGLALAQLNLGRALIEQGDVNTALECFQKCEDLHFQPYQVFYYKAKAYMKAGRTDDARAQLQLCLNKLPPGDAAQRIQQEIAALSAPHPVP